MNYIKFIKTFYNEDIQSSLHIFDIVKIVHYIVEKLDCKDCCFEHSVACTGSNIINGNQMRLSPVSSPVRYPVEKVENYPKIILSILEVI